MSYPVNWFLALEDRSISGETTKEEQSSYQASFDLQTTIKLNTRKELDEKCKFLTFKCQIVICVINCTYIVLKFLIVLYSISKVTCYFSFECV